MANKYALIILLLFIAQFSYAQKQGQSGIDSMLKDLSSDKYKNKEDTNKVKLLIHISWAYGEIVKPDESMKFAQEALELSSKLNWKRGIAYSYNELGGAYASNADYTKALECYDKAISIVTGERDMNELASITGTVGSIYYRIGDYKTALEDNFKALKINEKIGNKIAIPYELINIGLVYSDQGEYSKALEYYFNALKISETFGHKPNIATIYFNIAIVFTKEKENAKALENFNKALIIYKEIGNKISPINCYLAIGVVYQSEGRLTESMKYFQKALSIPYVFDNKLLFATLTNNIGYTYYIQYKYADAIEYFLLSVKIANEIGAKESVAEDYSSLGNCFLRIAENGYHGSISRVKLGENVGINHYLPVIHIPIGKVTLLRTASDYYRKALAIGQASNAPILIQGAYEGLTEVYKTGNDFKRALEYSEKAADIKDSLFSKENNEKIVRLEMKNDYDHQHLVDSLKQRQDIQAGKFKLQKQKLVQYLSLSIFIAIITTIFILQRTLLKRTKKQQQELFSRQLLESELKALRAQMNPHFIFNSLNSIQAFILKENKIEATAYLQKFSQLIRTILDNSQKTSNTIEEEAEILSLYMDLERMRLKDKFDFQIKIAKNIDPTFTEIPSMVLQPLVENSIWHGFMRSPQKGLLKVEFIKDENKLTCIVEDNGIGINRSKELCAKGQRTHESKGMKLIEDRLQAWSKMKGLQYELQITDDGFGTKTEITILYAAYA